MTSTPVRPGAVEAPPVRVRRRRDERAVAFFGTWMLFGLFLDGWAHQAEKPETFFSPWHGILYSGFVAAVARRADGVCGTGGMSVRMSRDLRLRERDGVTVAAGRGDRLRQLVRRHHPLMHRDVGDLLFGIDVHTDDAMRLVQGLAAVTFPSAEDRDRVVGLAIDGLRATRSS